MILELHTDAKMVDYAGRFFCQRACKFSGERHWSSKQFRFHIRSDLIRLRRETCSQLRSYYEHSWKLFFKVIRKSFYNDLLSTLLPHLHAHYLESEHFVYLTFRKFNLAVHVIKMDLAMFNANKEIKSFQSIFAVRYLRKHNKVFT